MTLHRTALLLFAFCLAVVAVAVAGQAPIPTSLSRITVTSSLRPEFTVNPGETRTGSLTIRNDGSQAALVEITQTDFSLDPAGQIRYHTGGESTRSNRPWVEVASQATVPPGASIEVPFTVRVPADSSLNGSYWSMIVVEPLERTSISEQADGNAGVQTNVSVSFRYGVTVLVNVGQPEGRRVLFANPQFTEDEDGYSLNLLVQNPGQFVVAADVWLELYDGQGNLVTKTAAQEIRLYPDASLDHSFSLGSLSPQSYQAVVIADAGGEDVFGVRYTLSVQSGENQD